MSLLDKKTAVSVLAKTHQNASTQIDVPGSVAAKIIQIGQRLIPDEALAGDGRVENPHITVKYGVQEDAETLAAVVSQFGPFTITLDRVEVFTPSESGNGSAPVVVEVHGAELVRMHKAVMQAMGTVGDDFPYVPHITVAYVKPEEAQHFAGNDSFAGITFTATAVTLSFHDDDVQEKVPLGKAAGEAIQYTIIVWPVIYNGSQQGYEVQRPPLEMYIVACSNVPELKKECAKAAARYAGKADIIVTSGFTTNYGSEKDEPKVRGLKQFWESGPMKSKKAAADKPLLRQLQALRPQMAAAAQGIYDGWIQDEDDEFNGGGICGAIAEAIQGIIVSSIGQVAVSEGGQDGDDHAWTIAHTDTEVYGVDISPSVYERGGGYSWTKIDDVQFEPRDVEVFAIDINPSELKSAAASPAMQPEIPQRPPQETDESEEKREPYEYRKQTHGDSWIVYDTESGDAVHFADSEADAQEAIKALESGQTPGQIQRTEPAVQQKQLPQTPKGWRAPKKPVTQLTNFKKWFGASKVVDDDGKPLKVYHGTTHDVESFSLDNANAENYYGKAFYFSSSARDVGTNYANQSGGDLTRRLEQYHEKLVQELSDDFNEENGYYPDGDELKAIEELAMDEAYQKLVGPNQGVILPVYLSIKKPVYVTKSGGTVFEINFDEETEDESGSGVDLYHAVLLCAGTYGADGGEIWGKVIENAGGDFSAYDFEEAVRNMEVETLTDDEGNITQGNFIADVYQELGFDGIIQNAWEEFGGGSKHKQMDMDYDTMHYIVFNPAQIKSATGNMGKFDKKNPAITGAVKPKSKEFLETMGEKVVEEKTIGDYDFFVTYNRLMGVYQIGMQRSGMDAADIGQQMEHQQQNRGAGSRQELKDTIQGWLNQYHMLVIGSMNPEKTMKYVRLLKAMGFNPQKQMVMGLPLAFITDGSIKTSSIKIAGRADATTSMVITVDPESVPWFPKKVLIRYEQGMRWRQVLTAVKAIVGEVASKRVAWSAIFIWKSPWDNYDAQQNGWESEKASGDIMYDVLHNGAYVSVGAQPQPPEEMLGATEEGLNYDPCPSCSAPMHMHANHRGEPLSETHFHNPELGTEANAYAVYPEKVMGDEIVPDLETLAPQLYKEGSTYGVDPAVDALSKKYEELGVSNYVSGSKVMPDYITLHEIVVPKDQRGEGLGTQFMEELTSYADNAGKIIVLTPDTVKGGSSVGRLQKFYGRFGFERNKGRNKDFRTTEAMIRRPMSKTAVFGEAQNQVQHTNHVDYGMSKTPKGDPFGEELAILHLMKGKNPPVAPLPLNTSGPKGINNADSQHKTMTSSKQAGLANLDSMGLYVVDEATVPGFELYLVGAKDDPEWFELAFQQAGQDSSQVETQHDKLAPKTIPRQELKAALDGWLATYGKIHVMSYNSKYLEGYVRLLAKLGYQVGKESELVEGKPAFYITGNLDKTTVGASTTPLGERGAAQASQNLPNSGNVTVFRGTPEPEDHPQPRDFAAAFFSADPSAAAQYGKVLQKYEVDMSREKILDIDDRLTPRLVREGMGRGLEDPGDLEDTTVQAFMFPWKDWVDFLKSKGYTGTSIGMDLALFDTSRIKKTSSFSFLAANYEEMFDAYFKLALHYPLPITPDTVKAEIDWCKKTLKKSDRIVWWLRWYRLAILEETRNEIEKKHDETERLYNMLKPGPEGQEPERHAVESVHKSEGEKVRKSGDTLATIRQMTEKEEKAMGNRIGRDLVGYPHISVAWFIRNHSVMQHYLSLPTQKIQNVVWDKQTPDGLRKDFEVAEKEWQEQTKGTLVPDLTPRYNSPEAAELEELRGRLKRVEERGDDPDYAYRIKKEIKAIEDTFAGQEPEIDTVFLKFADGWAWWKLSRAYCSEEAKAMGHCGNVVGQDKPDERILSLRKPVKAGKEDRWEPHLTFTDGIRAAVAPPQNHRQHWQVKKDYSPPACLVEAVRKAMPATKGPRPS